MIYVSYSLDRQMEYRLEVAQETIEAALNEMDKALDFARLISEKQNPEFWQAANRITLKQCPLIVFAIRYPIDSDLPIYEISWNPLFVPETGVALSEDGVEEQVRVESLPESEEVINIIRLDALSYAQAI